MKKTILAASIASFVALGLCGCGAPSQSAECIEVVVDFGILGESPAPSCVQIESETVPAKQLLQTAGFETEGTATYGDEIVCRVNGLPSAQESFQVEGEQPHTESCLDMPPAFAYWALWVKNSKDENWEYAQTGIGTLELKPGQSIGLVFSVAGETNTPN